MDTIAVLKKGSDPNGAKIRQVWDDYVPRWLGVGVTRRNLFGSGDCPTERQQLPSRSNIPKPRARLVPKRSRHRVATPRRLRFVATPGVRLRADFNIKQNQGRNWTVAATAELRRVGVSE